MNDAPRVDWRLASAVAAILIVLFSVANYTTQSAPSFPVTLARQTIVWGLWLALAPFIINTARNNPFGEGPRGRWIRRHLLIGGVFSIVHSVLGAAIRSVLGLRLVDDIWDAMILSIFSSLGRNYLSYGLIAASYQAVAYHRAVRERDAQAAQLRVDLAEARLASLEGRLRPHFLFNTLNAIAALIREDPQAAETMLEQLSELLRASLKADVNREVRLGEELALVEQYLAIQRVRFQDRLHVSLDANDAARRGYVPYLILQPLVENAVRHGIGPRESGGTVWVYAAQTDHRLRITVEDDGVGMGHAPPEHAGVGLGLGGVRSRLEHLYGVHQNVDVAERRPSGTRVTIEIPYRSDDTGSAGTP